MTKRLKLLAGVSILLVTTGVGAFLVWEWRLEPWLLFEKSRYGNMRHLCAGIADFVSHSGRLPKGLKEVVEAGYLPASSAVYECPMVHGSLRGNTIPYTKCEFDIRFEPNEVVISLLPDLIRLHGLQNGPSYLVGCRIDKSGGVNNR